MRVDTAARMSQRLAPRTKSKEAGVDREGFAFNTTGRPPEVANITTIAPAGRTGPTVCESQCPKF